MIENKKYEGRCKEGKKKKDKADRSGVVLKLKIKKKV